MAVVAEDKQRRPWSYRGSACQEPAKRAVGRGLSWGIFGQVHVSIHYTWDSEFIDPTVVAERLANSVCGVMDSRAFGARG